MTDGGTGYGGLFGLSGLLISIVVILAVGAQAGSSARSNRRLARTRSGVGR